MNHLLNVIVCEGWICTKLGLAPGHHSHRTSQGHLRREGKYNVLKLKNDFSLWNIAVRILLIPRNIITSIILTLDHPLIYTPAIVLALWVTEKDSEAYAFADCMHRKQLLEPETRHDQHVLDITYCQVRARKLASGIFPGSQ